jgi:hypothetical protein
VTTRRRHQSPAWLSTWVVVIAVGVMCIRAAMALRRSVDPTSSPASAAAAR